MKAFVRQLARTAVGPKLPVTAWWLWRTLGFSRPARLCGTVGVAGRSARLEWRQTGELLQAMSIFAAGNDWNRWQPAQPPRSILDVGANIGQTLAYWQLRFPQAQVAAVEMMPDNIDRIARQEQLNHWEFAVVAVAATDRAGTVRIRRSEANSRNRLAEIAAASAVRDRLTDVTLELPALPLGAILDRLKWTTVDLVKIDIEGAEEHLLRDAANWAGRVRTLIIELHDNVDRAAARSALEDSGFRIHPLSDGVNPEWLCTREPISLAPSAPPS